VAHKPAGVVGQVAGEMAPASTGAITLMAVLAGLLVVGLAVTLRWAARPYRPTEGPPAVRYLRGVAVALVAGFWAGALVTGPAVRLAMRLLAVTGGDDAQRRFTEADEIVGRVDVGGSIALVVFGGILPGLLSGGIYVLVRRLLPAGAWGGVVFGLLHLVVAATRLDPLRPDNADFDLVGPGWLAVVTFGLAAVAHGMAVAAFAARYSAALPPATPATRAAWVRALGPLVLPVLLLVPFFVVALQLAVGLVVAVVMGRLPGVMRAVRSPRVVTAGRVALVVLALVLLPGAIDDVHDVVVRDEVTANPSSALRGPG
jgi:hypothetical protein